MLELIIYGIGFFVLTLLLQDNGLEQSTFSQEFQIEKNGLARNLSGYFCTVCFIQAVLWECTRCFRLWDAVKRVCQWRF